MRGSESALARADRADARRDVERSARRQNRRDTASSQPEELGQRHTCSVCWGVFDTADMMPSTEHCIACHASAEADAIAGAVAASWMPRARAHLAIQLGAMAFVAVLYAMNLWKAQAFAVHSIALIFVGIGTMYAVRHAVDRAAPSRAMAWTFASGQLLAALVWICSWAGVIAWVEHARATRFDHLFGG